MKLDTKHLRDLAASATQPGPWSVSEEHPNLILDANGFWLADVGPAPKDAAFIAACSPEVVIALLDKIEKLHGYWQLTKRHLKAEQRKVKR